MIYQQLSALIFSVTDSFAPFPNVFHDIATNCENGGDQLSTGSRLLIMVNERSFFLDMNGSACVSIA